jgi:hypothetical protein
MELHTEKAAANSAYAKNGNAAASCDCPLLGVIFTVDLV